MSTPPTFAETLFGAMGLPGFGAAPAGADPIRSFSIPTVDVDELDRRIADLRSVEGWLQTQATMVRTTIQALEVQRNTIVMVKSFGATMPDAGAIFTAAAQAAKPASASAKAAGGAAGSKAPDPAPDPLRSAAAEAAMNQASAWWTMLQDQFARMAAVVPPVAESAQSASPRAKRGKAARTASVAKPSASPRRRKPAPPAG